MRIVVIGAGAWGAALSTTFAANHQVSLWARDANQRRGLREHRRSAYLAEVTLPASVQIADDLAAALGNADLALIATPTSGLREAIRAVHTLCRVNISRPSAARLSLAQAAQTAQSSQASQLALPIVWACKGLEQGSARLPHQIAAEELPSTTARAVLSGPSFALEVGRGQPTALTLASADEVFARTIARELHHPRLRVYSSNDIVGVEVGGAVKNVLAIATGIADGLGLGLNARAGLITRGLAELTRLGLALGGRVETFLGLTGVGDLILTCTGDLSRNRRVGLALASGQSLDAVLAGLGHVAEGVRTARSVAQIASSVNVEMPITRAVCAVLFDGVAARVAVEQLLARDPKAES